MGVMVLFIGIQASGKTSFYKKYLSGYEHISLDILNTRHKEKKAIEECMAKNRDFVVDNTNPCKADRQRYFDMIKGRNYQVVGYYFCSSITACMERNEQRSGKQYVPPCAIASTFRKLELPSLEEGFTDLYYVRIEGEKFVAEDWKAEEEVGKAGSRDGRN